MTVTLQSRWVHIHTSSPPLPTLQHTHMHTHTPPSHTHTLSSLYSNTHTCTHTPLPHTHIPSPPLPTHTHIHTLPLPSPLTHTPLVCITLSHTTLSQLEPNTLKAYLQKGKASASLHKLNQVHTRYWSQFQYFNIRMYAEERGHYIMS